MVNLKQIREKYNLSNLQIAEIAGVSKSSIDIATSRRGDPDKNRSYASIVDARLQNMIEYFRENWAHLAYDVHGMAIVILGTPGIYKIPREIRQTARIISR